MALSSEAFYSVSSSWYAVKRSLPLDGFEIFWYDPIPDGVASRMGESGFDDMGFALVLGVVGGDDCRSDVLLFPDTLSASSIAAIEGSCPLGASRARSSQSYHFHQCRCSVKNLTACRQQVLRHV